MSFALAVAGALLCACAGAPNAAPTAGPAPTAPAAGQAPPTAPPPSPILATVTSVPALTPEVSQRNSAGVPLPFAPGAVNVVVTYTPVPSGAAQVKSGLITISVGDNYFDPDDVHVAAGSTVEWDYNGGGGETESIHNVIALDKSFSSGDLNPNSRYAFTFKQAGEVDYVCSYHARQMTGKIVVQ